MTGTEIYQRTPTYEKQAREIRLLAPHWKLLLAFDGLRTLSEVALSAETSFADALPLTQKFLEQGWIDEQPITLDQYIKRANTRDITGTSAPVAPAVVLHEPGKEKSAAAPAPPPPLPAVTIPKTVPLPSLDKPPIAKSPRGAMKLSAVVDFITSLVGNVSLGQLLVYRVFLRVPPDLLLAEDIASVSLVNDTSLIQTEKLQKAVADAVNAVTKRALPDSVFASA